MGLSPLKQFVLGLLAAAAKLSLGVTTALAAFRGLYHGYLNGTGMGLFETAAVALLGLVFAVFVPIALAAALVVRLRAEWARIAQYVLPEAESLPAACSCSGGPSGHVSYSARSLDENSPHDSA